MTALKLPADAFEQSCSSLMTQTAVQVTSWVKDSLDGASLAKVAIPEPSDGEALLRIILRPVNPTDLISLHGGRANLLTLPWTPGSEGRPLATS